MTKRPALQLPAPVYVRLLAVAMTCVMSGLGLLALISAHTEARWTRYGFVGPLEGGAARGFGLAMFFFGLMPLVLAMRSPKAAMRLGISAVVLGFVAVFAGPALLG